MSRVDVTESAQSDLESITAFIARNNRSAATRTLGKLREQMELLASHRLLGQLRDDLQPNVRMSVSGNYVIYFTPTDSGILVRRVLHAAQRESTAFFDNH